MPSIDMTGYTLAPKQLGSASEVREAAARIMALRLAGRIKRMPKTVEVRAERAKDILEKDVWPDWTTALFGEPQEKSNVIEVSFPVVRPVAVFRQYPAIQDIIALVADFYRVQVVDIKSARRTRKIVRPRQIAAYLSKVMTPKSLPEIGRLMGDRDHTTILWAVRKIETLCATDETVRDDIDVLRMKIADYMAAQNQRLTAK